MSHVPFSHSEFCGIPWRRKACVCLCVCLYKLYPFYMKCHITLSSTLEKISLSQLMSWRENPLFYWSCTAQSANTEQGIWELSRSLFSFELRFSVAEPFFFQQNCKDMFVRGSCLVPFICRFIWWDVAVCWQQLKKKKEKTHAALIWQHKARFFSKANHLQEHIGSFG